MIRFTAALGAAVLIAACSQADDALSRQDPAADTDAALSGVEWTASFDPSGYYLPNGALSAAGWTVEFLFLPPEYEITAWREAGGAPADLPVWLEIRPDDAEPAMNEQGREYYPDARRVRPDALLVADGRFELRAADSPAGAVLISGRIQPEHLQGEAIRPQEGAAALVGGLEIGGERLRNVSFMHWHGD